MKNIQEIEKYTLKSGKHDSLEHGACVMELVSYIADEPWSDHPQCACPVLTAYAIRYNDRVNDEQRQKLKALIPLLVGSRNKDMEKKRAQFFGLKAVTVFLPTLTDAFELPEISTKLRSFTINQFIEARDYINSKKSEIREAAGKRPADAAYADASAAAAADAADAAAAYAYAYAAAASAAAAARKNKTFWFGLKQKLWDQGLDALKEACELKDS